MKLLSACGVALGELKLSVAPGGPARAALQVRCGSDPEKDKGGGAGKFFAGFLIGGAVCGTLAFLFAPQLSKRLLAENDRLRLPRFLDDDDSLETTRRTLNDKIAQLNTAIDEVSAQLEDSDSALRADHLTDTSKEKSAA